MAHRLAKKLDRSPPCRPPLCGHLAVKANPCSSSPHLVGTVRRVEADAYDLYRSGQRLLEEREAPAAVALLEQAARQLPDERAILRLLALAYYGSASFTAAEPLLRRLVDADPLDADSLHMLGKTLEITGRPEQAQQYFALAGRLTPAYAVSCQAWGGERIPADATCAMVPMTSAD